MEEKFKLGTKPNPQLSKEQLGGKLPQTTTNRRREIRKRRSLLPRTEPDSLGKCYRDSLAHCKIHFNDRTWNVLKWSRDPNNILDPKLTGLEEKRSQVETLQTDPSSSFKKLMKDFRVQDKKRYILYLTGTFPHAIYFQKKCGDFKVFNPDGPHKINCSKKKLIKILPKIIKPYGPTALQIINYSKKF